ncbi:MAG: group II intron reverse transcriptase/maturase [Cyanobacteria bacterium P01_D01_bin.50]
MVSQYQAEYRGIVQYYPMAYRRPTLAKLKWVMEVSLAKTLAKKFKTSCRKIYKRYCTTIDTRDGTYRVLQVTVERDSKKPLTTPKRWCLSALE